MVGIDSHQEFAFHGFYINVSGDEHGTIICIWFASICARFYDVATTMHSTVGFASASPMKLSGSMTGTEGNNDGRDILAGRI